jgi:hypothetical protein
MTNTGTPGILNDIKTTIANAIQEARARTRRGELVDNDLVDAALAWLLAQGNNGQGWAGERVRFPKVDRDAVVRSVLDLDAEGLSSSAIGQTLGMPASTVRTILSRHQQERETQ